MRYYWPGTGYPLCRSRGNETVLDYECDGGNTEAAILAGMDIVMIPGDETNSKVTTDADLEQFNQRFLGE